MGKLHLRQSQPTLVKAEKALPVLGPTRMELDTEISGQSDNQLMIYRSHLTSFEGIFNSLCSLHSWGWPLWVSKFLFCRVWMISTIQIFGTNCCPSEQNKINGIWDTLFIYNYLHFSEPLIDTATPQVLYKANSVLVGTSGGPWKTCRISWDCALRGYIDPLWLKRKK